MNLSIILYIVFSIFILFVSCESSDPAPPTPLNNYVELISFFHPSKNLNGSPFKLKYTNYQNQLPRRWIEVDSSGNLTLDYIYEYDSKNRWVKAMYLEEGDGNYGIERMSYPDDNTKLTEWLDSTGQVYYTMTEDLDSLGRVYRATFSNLEETHGYDTTYYNQYGFPKRIFFTSTKGKVLNDRNFDYDSINSLGEWIVRSKRFGDSIAEVQIKSFLPADSASIIDHILNREAR